MAITLNKRILDKIERRCEGDRAMLDYMHDIVMFEFREPKQYAKHYKESLEKFSKQSKA